VASQFHPEFKSRPERPHPLFNGFVAAAIAEQAAERHSHRTPESAGSERAPADRPAAVRAEDLTPAG
jgi:hypothetical protein